MTDAILYAAKSTQDRRRSIDTQLEDGRDFAEEHGLDVVAEYRDEGFSAFSGNRGPGLRAAEQHAARIAAETGQPCMIVAQAADRFARGAGDAPGASEHLVEIWTRWRRQNVHMRTVEDDEYMHSAERVAARGELANLESKRKSRSVTKGMKRRRTGSASDDGLPRHTGGAVFGYRRDEAKGLVPDPITGPVVVRIFTMAAAHKSVVDIAKTLQAEYEATGFPAPLRSTSWRQGSISNLLSRRTVLGEVGGDDPAARKRRHVPEAWIKAAHDPIPGMTEELWQAARDAVDARAKKPGAGGGRKSVGGHLFVKGALRHTCGNAMTPVTNRNAKGEITSTRYVCSGAKEGRCDQPPFRLDRAIVDDSVLSYLADVGIDAAATLAALRKAAETEGEGTAAELEAARSEGAKLQAQYDRMWSLFKDGDLDADDWSRFKTENANERKANAAAVERLEAQAETIAQGPDAIVPMAADALALVRASVAGGDVDAVRGALGTLFEEFVVGEVDDLPDEAVTATPQEARAARVRLREQVAAMEAVAGRTVAEGEAQAGAEEEALRQLIGDPTNHDPDPLDIGLSPADDLRILPVPREDALQAIVRDGRPVQMVGEDGRLVFRRLPLDVAPSGLTGGATTNHNGLARKSSAPASKARIRSTSPQRPLSTSTGSAASIREPAASAARTWRTTPSPEASGSPTSSTARSGKRVSMRRSASRAESAVSSSQPSAVSSSARNVRVDASSSATRMVAGVSSVMTPLGRQETKFAPHREGRLQIGRIRVPSAAADRADGLQDPSQGLRARRVRAYDADDFGSRRPPRRDHTRQHHMNDARRGNYDSGEDFVLEYGELRFTFNERDFRERCEQAANKLGFVSGRLDDPELEDLVTLSVNGEIQEPASALGEHVNDCWPELVGPSDRSLVHWLRRLVFRSAWLDQRVKEGELDVEFDADSHTFMYVQPDRDGEPVELAPEPSWGRVAYVPR